MDSICWQVFEATIRVLGGLLSAHLLATDPAFDMRPANYSDELLSMAHDLGPLDVTLDMVLTPSHRERERVPTTGPSQLLTGDSATAQRTAKHTGSQTRTAAYAAHPSPLEQLHSCESNPNSQSKPPCVWSLRRQYTAILSVILALARMSGAALRLVLSSRPGVRLLPAFDNTPTGLPHPRVNLRHGVPLDGRNDTYVSRLRHGF